MSESTRTDVCRHCVLGHALPSARRYGSGDVSHAPLSASPAGAASPPASRGSGTSGSAEQAHIVCAAWRALTRVRACSTQL